MFDIPTVKYTMPPLENPISWFNLFGVRVFAFFPRAPLPLPAVDGLTDEFAGGLDCGASSAAACSREAFRCRIDIV